MKLPSIVGISVVATLLVTAPAYADTITWHWAGPGFGTGLTSGSATLLPGDREFNVSLNVDSKSSRP